MDPKILYEKHEIGMWVQDVGYFTTLLIRCFNIMQMLNKK